MRKRRKPIALLLASVLLLLGCLPAFAQGNFTLGDLNQNGKVDAGDALLILKHRVSKIQLTEDRLLAAEVSGDGVVNMADAWYLLLYAVGNLTRFPAQPEPPPATPEEPAASPTDPAANGELPLNAENFPDLIFRTKLIQFDTDFNKHLSPAEIEKITKIDFSRDRESIYPTFPVTIKSMKGLEHFPRLKELYCGANDLTELDVSQNPELEIIRCNSNSISELNLENNPALTTLACSNNDLTQLNLQNNPALRHLTCSVNDIAQLDVSNNPLLISLNCDLTDLTQLDVSQNPELAFLHCSDNSLTALDVSKNPKLKELWCDNNQITQLDVSKNVNLKDLWCTNNLITELDVTGNPLLTSLLCDDGVTLTGWPKGTN